MERPHYLLFAEANVEERCRGGAGRWRFVLESLDGTDRIEADDVDDDARLDRLNLLAVVRGLEALEGPSRVTLLTMSWYVRRGFSEGLELWRQRDFKWETFGQWTSVTNEDLWRRVDRALQFHVVSCRTWRLDAAEIPAPHILPPAAKTSDVSAASQAPDPYRAAVREPHLSRLRKPRIEASIATVATPADAYSETGTRTRRSYSDRMRALAAATTETDSPLPPRRRKRA